jgi:starch phosphorylase
VLDPERPWNHVTDEVWRQLDPTLWGLTPNPWVILPTVSTVSRARLRSLAADPAFRQKAAARVRHQVAAAPGWFQKAHPGALLTRGAYFHSGALGHVAGDQFNARSGSAVAEHARRGLGPG